VKLEKMKLATSLNHFALKSKIYMASMRAALTAFQELWGCTQNMAFA
jgi:hypothetical protein